MAAYSVLSSCLGHCVGMRLMTRRSFATIVLASGAVAAGLVSDAARADKKRKGRGDRDHDDAWRAREDGSTLPLSRVLDIVVPQIDGKIIETEFEYEDGQPVYEFKYVDRQGRVRELYVDARTGVIIKDKPD